ncbi:MAG: nuclear transport factor 2 family protein [Polyangiaceae bacterium]|jgi:ketosteroid isomerase-like protein|nr:nuclear transport factor 2 family protein [Polyangiaceae bacterium]
MPSRRPRFFASLASLASLLALVVLAACLTHCRARGHDPSAEVRALLDTQAAAWNRGDIEGFMQGYWNSPELRFASGGNVTMGWKPTLDRYKARYSDRAAMGTLAFTDLDVRPAGDDAALAFGTWRLTREGSSPHGLFTLFIRRTSEGWRIVHDHTSSAD